MDLGTFVTTLLASLGTFLAGLAAWSATRNRRTLVHNTAAPDEPDRSVVGRLDHLEEVADDDSRRLRRIEDLVVNGSKDQREYGMHLIEHVLDMARHIPPEVRRRPRSPRPPG